MLRHPFRILAALLAFVLLAAACGDDGGTDTTPGSGGDNGTESSESGGGAGGTITFGLIPWDEDIAVTYLWKNILEDQGYDVKITEVDVGPTFQGLARGDLDLFLDTWLPATHEDYWAEYGDDLEDLGIWYDQGTLNIAVPSYVDVDTIADLAGKADQFGGRIVGIEPGAGLMRMTRESAMPGYGLEGEYDLLESSTTAMLAELERALDRNEPIVVTLWHPHWAYAAFDIKDLADPEGLLGGAEEIHAVARKGFAADFPDVAKWFGNFTLDDDQLASLEQLVINDFGPGKEAEGVAEWLSDSDNAALVESWLS